MTPISIILTAHTALAGTMTATDTTMVAIGTAKTDEVNGVGPVMVTGAAIEARLWWFLVR